MEKIKKYSIYTAKAALDKPIADATHTLTEISFIVLRLELNNGVIGESYMLSFQYSRQAISGALKDIAAMVIDQKVHDMVSTFTGISNLNEYFGKEGVNRWAQAAINIAMWDAWCKVLGQPVWKVLGGSAVQVPVYGSGGWLSYSMDELINEVTAYKKRGFHAVKIKVGKPEWKEDLERLRKVREAAGQNVRIMMDANQGMTVSNALQLAISARELDIYWFEEPIDHHDFAGYQLLRNQGGISLAMGEREYSTTALRELAKLNAIDIWQPDILRIGGVEAWRNSAALAQAYGIPVLPHYYKDYDVPLLCTITNGAGAESFDWIDPLIDNPLIIENGYANPRESAGWGFHFKDAYLSEVDS